MEDITGRARAMAERARFDKVLDDIECQIDVIAERRQYAVHIQQKRELSSDKPYAPRGRRRFKQSEARCGIMNLPYFIRLKILYNVIGCVWIPQPMFSSDRFGPIGSSIRTHPLARVGNQRLRLESLMVMIEQATIGLDNVLVQQWLSNIDFTKLEGDTGYRTGYDAVKTLAVTVRNGQALFPTKCTNLRKLILNFTYDMLIGEHGGAKSALQLSQEYRLDCVLLSLHLQSVEITHFCWLMDGDAAFESIANLLQWLRSELKARGKPVQIIADIEILAW